MPCEFAENKLKIIDNQPEDGIKKKFGVCVKQITFEDKNSTVKFVEWIHLLKILGADKIYVYNRFVHPDLFKAMKYFEDQGILDLTSFLEPSAIPYELRSPLTRTVEILSLNDCFYRIRNLYEYILVLDPDEVPIPMRENETTWHDFVDTFVAEDDVGENRTDFFSFRSLTFPDLNAKPVEKYPTYHYALQHVQVSFQLSL